MSDEAFNPLCYAKRELVPLVDALVACAKAESSHDQVFYFSKIKHGIENCGGFGRLDRGVFQSFRSELCWV